MVLWYFWIYSFLGYLLERAFAAVTHAEHQGRRCFLLLPLCPVYGLGMLAVLALPPDWTEGGWLVISGGLAATAVEYAVHWAYETTLGIRFWDYANVPGNLRGRVCLPFTLAWGILTAAAVWWIQWRGWPVGFPQRRRFSACFFLLRMLCSQPVFCG